MSIFLHSLSFQVLRQCLPLPCDRGLCSITCLGQAGTLCNAVSLSSLGQLIKFSSSSAKVNLTNQIYKIWLFKKSLFKQRQLSLKRGGEGLCLKSCKNDSIVALSNSVVTSHRWLFKFKLKIHFCSHTSHISSAH